MAEIPLQGQVAIITGASRGIGAAIAERLAGLGAQLVLAARDRSRLQSLAAALPRPAGAVHLAVPCDLRIPEQISELANTALARCGQVDLLINNAGLGTFGTPLHELPLADWDAMLETNLRAVYLLIRALAPHMIARQSGQIINISSLAAHNPVPGAAAYAATKWALNGLTVSVAEELRKYRVRVSLICPGSVATALNPGRDKDVTRMLQPSDVAHAVATLALQAPQSFISEVLIRPTQKP